MKHELACIYLIMDDHTDEDQASWDLKWNTHYVKLGFFFIHFSWLSKYIYLECMIMKDCKFS